MNVLDSLKVLVDSSMLLACDAVVTFHLLDVRLDFLHLLVCCEYVGLMYVTPSKA
jgi:hypothetical protein